MNIDTEYLKARFGKFNAAYFGNTLPKPEFRITRSRTILGQFRCTRERHGLLRRYVCTDFKIKVSGYYEMPEREYDNVLLHEMIHMYIAVKGLKDTSPHGRVFRNIMERLNSTYGWSISISANTRRWAVAEANRRTRYDVLTLETTDGRMFVAVINPAYVAHVDAMATRSAMIKSHSWHVSASNYFSSFPLTRSLRGRRVSRDEMKRILQTEVVEGNNDSRT